MKAWEQLRQTTEFSQVPEWVPEDALRSFKQSMGDYILDGCHGFWLEPEAKDGHTDPDSLVVTLGRRLNVLSQCYNAATTQSPIEDMLLGALVWLDKDWGGMPDACMMDGPDAWLEWLQPRKEIQFWIKPQAKIKGYRADFLLWFSYEKLAAGIAVECDGHQFHEKTKEQASRDKKRDREILAAGFPVVRFSGSDIYKSPQDCASQVSDLLTDALDRVSRAAGLYA